MSKITMHHDIPNIKELGLDLLKIKPFTRLLLLLLPFTLSAFYFVFAILGYWFLAVLSLILLSFFTYGSISHDLVHRSLGLPRKLNSFLLSAIELLTLRSGHAYKHAHLYHHKRYPNNDDIEGSAARMSFFRTLLEGVIFHPKICIWAVKNVQGKSDRNIIIIEISLIIALILVSIVLIPTTLIFMIYVALLIMGSWIIPLITSYIPHAPDAPSELSQTRLFRGKVLSIIALEHLYHLEHHLYPSVPHTNWPRLAKRLDPYFEKAGIKPVKLWF